MQQRDAKMLSRTCKHPPVEILALVQNLGKFHEHPVFGASGLLAGSNLVRNWSAVLDGDREECHARMANEFPCFLSPMQKALVTTEDISTLSQQREIFNHFHEA